MGEGTMAHDGAAASAQDWQALLEAALARVRDEQRLAADNARPVVLDQTSVGRLSRMDALQQQAMAQAALQRLSQQQRRLEAALARLAQGRYGLCCVCEATIESTRLRHDPAVPFCRDCQDERDAEREAERRADRRG